MAASEQAIRRPLMVAIANQNAGLQVLQQNPGVATQPRFCSVCRFAENRRFVARPGLQAVLQLLGVAARPRCCNSGVSPHDIGFAGFAAIGATRAISTAGCPLARCASHSKRAVPCALSANCGGDCLTCIATLRRIRVLVCAAKTKSWQHPEVFPGGPPPQY